ncbi:MAG: outer membrane protein assembly factor [Bacteroides sp.]|nr:outer membrane protein assembly factor [Bacteroides sp.]MCM1414070.1 outer membrane protein assembly factor [Bacteroides sp.]MCM1472331.1 outer membrane protein assembly factor [Bacteroides sp.]
MNRLLKIIILTALLWVVTGASAQKVTAVTDSVPVEVSADSAVVHKPNIFKRLINYFNESNKPKEYKGFDWSIIGGPHYSGDTRLGIGVVAAGFYRNDLTDSITAPSNISLYGDVSTVGFFLVGIRGNHIFTGDTDRIDYNLYFYSFPRKFWGIGYDQGLDMSNKSDFKEVHVEASVSYLHAIAPSLFVGPCLAYTYSHAARMERPELWDGQPFHSSTYSVGGRIQYDTRDNMTATQSGFLAQLEQRFSPKFLGNKQAFSSTELNLSVFKNMWRGSVFAAHYHGELSYGNVPWAVMPSFGGSNSMRGYYDGRFRDKGEMDLTVELRQHVWRRNGIVVWAGVGTVFPKFSAMRFDHLLPNGGIGYRWEFKQRTNVRLDYGFGRGESSFIFSINEAF